MEDIYIFIADCVSSLSALFTFHSLLQISTSSKFNSNCIYELSIHHIPIHLTPIYYTCTNQIKKFHNIKTLIIPKYYQYKNLSQLTHINNILFYNTQLINHITNLTHLTSCFLINKYSTESFFHTNLRKLYDFESGSLRYNIGDIASLTQITRINTLRCQDLNDIMQLKMFRNLKSLNMKLLKNIDYISSFELLYNLNIRAEIPTNSLIIQHSTLTNINISNVKNCSFENSNNLKYLALTDCEKCELLTYSTLRTLILWNIHYHPPEKINFDINKCVNLEYLRCCQNIITLNQLKLFKLNSLWLKRPTSIEICNIIATNITYLSIEYLKEIDFANFVNLKILNLNQSRNVNMDKLSKLENLTLFADLIDFQNHLNLTYLQMTYWRYGTANLHRLTKLNTLILSCLSNKVIRKLWQKDISYLSALTYLDISNDENSKVAFNGEYLSNNVLLKSICCNFEISNLQYFNKFNDLSHLEIFYHSSWINSIVTNLTKLTCLRLKMNNTSIVNLRNLTRLNFVNENQSNIIYPEMRMIE